MIPASADPIPTVTQADRAYFARCDRAYESFSKLGWDTAKIALLMNTTEARVEKYVTVGRCRSRGLPVPYGVE